MEATSTLVFVFCLECMAPETVRLQMWRECLLFIPSHHEEHGEALSVEAKIYSDPKSLQGCSEEVRYFKCGSYTASVPL